MTPNEKAMTPNEKAMTPNEKEEPLTEEEEKRFWDLMINEAAYLSLKEVAQMICDGWSDEEKREYLKEATEET